MKRNSLVLGLLFLFLTGCAGSSYMVKATPPESPAPEKPQFISCGPQAWVMLSSFKSGTAPTLSV